MTTDEKFRAMIDRLLARDAMETDQRRREYAVAAMAFFLGCAVGLVLGWST